MKKLCFAALALLLLAACNQELGPEYTTPPQFGVITFSPITPKATQEVTVNAQITSTYGLQAAQIVFRLNDDQKQDATKPFYYKETDVSVNFKGVIPKQVPGTKVTFQVIAVTPHGVLNGSKPYSYTVVADEAELPIFASVTYVPKLPTPTENVIVTSRIRSTNGLNKVQLSYTIEGETEAHLTAPVLYTKEDTDVLFVGEIPAQQQGAKVAVHVIAETSYGVSAQSQSFTYMVAPAKE